MYRRLGNCNGELVVYYDGSKREGQLATCEAIGQLPSRRHSTGICSPVSQEQRREKILRKEIRS